MDEYTVDLLNEHALAEQVLFDEQGDGYRVQRDPHLFEPPEFTLWLSHDGAGTPAFWIATGRVPSVTLPYSPDQSLQTLVRAFERLYRRAAGTAAESANPAEDMDWEAESNATAAEQLVVLLRENPDWSSKFV